MTVHSLFSTCSTTKAFTDAAASLVIDDSKSTAVPISWATPVSSLIRDDFVLADDHATAHTTLEDALSHRSGVFGAMRWAHPTESLRDAVRKLRHLPVAHPPRSTWDYCNHMYMAVSHALEQRTGVDLGSFLQRRIWAPLRMNHTYFSIGDVENSPAKKPRLARGYSWLPDSESYTPEPYMNYSPITGTGAIVSNVLDYARWLRALIYKSTPLSPPIFDRLVQSRSIISSDGDLYPPGPYHLYALGWWVENYAGEQFYWHSGSWPGFGTLVGFVPERGFGFVVMRNTVDARIVGKALYTRLMDKLLGLCPKDFHGPDIKMKDSGCEGQGLDVSRLTNSLQPSLPLEQYTGLYVHQRTGVPRSKSTMESYAPTSRIGCSALVSASNMPVASSSRENCTRPEGRRGNEFPRGRIPCRSRWQGAAGWPGFGRCAEGKVWFEKAS
jgi:CubicO group peptidase (beta-lactamase class C family)